MFDFTVTNVKLLENDHKNLRGGQIKHFKILLIVRFTMHIIIGLLYSSIGQF